MVSQPLVHVLKIRPARRRIEKPRPGQAIVEVRGRNRGCEDAAGFEHALNFRQGRSRLRNVFKHAVGKREVEAVISLWHAIRAAGVPTFVTAEFRRESGLGEIGINTCERPLRTDEVCENAGERAVAATDVEAVPLSRQSRSQHG